MRTLHLARCGRRCAVALCAATIALVAHGYELVVNGSFEQNGGAGTTALTGWSSGSLPGSQGGFYVQTATRGPITKFDVPSPPQGAFAAMNDQSGPGTRVLYQDIAIPAGPSAAFSAQIYVRNAGEQWYTPTTLDYATMPNQQVRVDVVSTSASITDVGAGVLRNLYRTQTGDARFSAGYVTVTGDLSAFAGQTVRVRFAAVDNRQSLLFGVDAVSVTVPGTLPSSLSLTATPSPAILGNTVTLRATISAASAITATGGVNFLADNVAIPGCSGVVPVNNIATCTTSSLALGNRALRADFAGDSNFAASSGAQSLAVITTPSAPTNVVAAARNSALAISFGVPASDGGAAISGYSVTCTPTGGGSAVTATVSGSPATVQGLANGTSYQCSVAAVNAAGTGQSASAATATPAAITQVSVVTSQGTVTLTLTPSGATCGFTVAEATPASSLPAAPLSASYGFQYGLVRFLITGCTTGATIPVDIQYPAAVPATAQYWKYGRTVASATPLWYQFPFTQTSATSIRISLTDGGAGDDDRTADGSISDPGGLAVSSIPPTIPTLGHWALLLSALLIAWFAASALRGRRERGVR